MHISLGARIGPKLLRQRWQCFSTIAHICYSTYLYNSAVGRPYRAPLPPEAPYPKQVRMSAAKQVRILDIS